MEVRTYVLLNWALLALLLSPRGHGDSEWSLSNSNASTASPHLCTTEHLVHSLNTLTYERSRTVRMCWVYAPACANAREHVCARARSLATPRPGQQRFGTAAQLIAANAVDGKTFLKLDPHVRCVTLRCVALRRGMP